MPSPTISILLSELPPSIDIFFDATGDIMAGAMAAYKRYSGKRSIF
jgi:hypothetical protein